MKVSAPSSPKFMHLQSRLSLARWEAVGLLESLWMLGATQCRDGRIGRFSDDLIAACLGWDRSPGSTLIEALVECRWVDRVADAEGRLVIHDWADHCPNFVKGVNARSAPTKCPTKCPTKSGTDPGSTPQLSTQLSRPLSTQLSTPLSRPLSGVLPSQAKPSQAKPEEPHACASENEQPAKLLDFSGKTVAEQAAMLSQQWFFCRPGAGRMSVDHDTTAYWSDLLAAGFSPEALNAEIRSKNDPGCKVRSEPIWVLKSRLMASQGPGKASPPPAPKLTDAERAKIARETRERELETARRRLEEE